MVKIVPLFAITGCLLLVVHSASIGVSQGGGISTVCNNGKCKTVSTQGHLSLNCKGGKCKKEGGTQNCLNGKCTYSGNAPDSSYFKMPKFKMPKFKWPLYNDYGSDYGTDYGDYGADYGMGFGNFGNFGYGGFRMCKDGEIQMQYTAGFSCFKTICFNGQWVNKQYPGACHA